MSLKHEKERLIMAFLCPISPFAFFMNGLMMVMWGLWVLSPFWDAFTTATFYEIVSATAPECFWGAMAIIAGVVKLWGARSMDIKKLMYASYAGVLMWGTLATTYWFSDWSAPGTMIMTFLCLNAVWHYLNLKVTKGERIY